MLRKLPKIANKKIVGLDQKTHYSTIMQKSKSNGWCEQAHIYLVSYVEFVDEIQIDKHSRRCTQSRVVVQWKVAEFVVNKRQLLRFGYRQLLCKLAQFTVHIAYTSLILVTESAGSAKFVVSSITAAKTWKPSLVHSSVTARISMDG